MKEALILAKGEGQDVYNALNLMDNSDDLFNELKFGIGDGNLNYYLYNWQCMPMQHRVRRSAAVHSGGCFIIMAMHLGWWTL